MRLEVVINKPWTIKTMCKKTSLKNQAQTMKKKKITKWNSPQNITMLTTLSKQQFKTKSLEMMVKFRELT